MSSWNLRIGKDYCDGIFGPKFDKYFSQYLFFLDLTSKVSTRVDKPFMYNQYLPQRLIFRRQFILGTEEFHPNHYWSSHQLQQGLILSIHEDLSFSSETDDDITVTLIGLAVDPFHPQWNETEILRTLLDESSDLISFINNTKALIGRWIIIFQNDLETFLFTDPCGLRQIFFLEHGEKPWCASQPELINTKYHLSFSNSRSVLGFMTSLEYAQKESAWVGDSTLYDNCYHLLPNHYLDYWKSKQIRFYPNKPILPKETQEIINTAASILQGGMTALSLRSELLLGLTSGWDSRILLAAARNSLHNLECYVDRKELLTEDHPDVQIPMHMAEKMKFNLDVRNSKKELPGWFIHFLTHNVTGARVLPKTRMIYDKLISDEQRLVINGNGGEICRNYYDKSAQYNSADSSLNDLVDLFGYRNTIPFVMEQIEKWRSGLAFEYMNGFDVLDLLYWEQRMGNWGALFPAEQDTAVEEISPFNCRLLIETLLSAPRHLRAAPDYILFKELIHKMWPELLSFPFNPKPKVGLTKVCKQKTKYFIRSFINKIAPKRDKANS